MKSQLTVIMQYMMKCTPLISDNGRFFFCIKNTHQRLYSKDISPNNIFPYSCFFCIIAAFEPFIDVENYNDLWICSGKH